MEHTILEAERTVPFSDNEGDTQGPEERAGGGKEMRTINVKRIERMG